MNTSDEHIWEMEWDQYTDDGSMLIAWGNALVSVDGKGGQEVIAGSVDDRGYKEGTGKNPGKVIHRKSKYYPYYCE